MEITLSYQNEDDRAYGLAGMAIALAAMDALDRVSSVDIDAEGPMVSFAHSYYFNGSPSISPKTTWHNLVKNFQITTNMVVSNVMSRCVVRMQQSVPSHIMTKLRDNVCTEGEETCALEKDESQQLFDNAVAYSRRIFHNPRLHPQIREFASTLSRRRSLSGLELIDELHRLQFI